MNISNISEIKNIDNNFEELKINKIEDINKNFETIETTGNGNCLFENLISCMNDNKIFKNFESNKLRYITNLREQLAVYLLSGNCLDVNENLYCKNTTPEEFANKIKTNYNCGNYEISIFSLLYNCQINVVCHELKNNIININKIGNGNYCIWLYYKYYKSFENTNEHYVCLIPRNKANIGDYETYNQMKNKIINDLNIKTLNNPTQYIIDQKLEKNIFKENDYLFNDDNCLYICFCDFLHTNHNLYIFMRKLIDEKVKIINKCSNDKNRKGNEKDIEIFTLKQGSMLL